MSNDRKRLSTIITLILATIFTTAAAAHGQIGGVAVETGGLPLEGATIHVWDAYPSGSAIHSVVTGADGAFSLPATGAGEFDLRITKDGFYPTVIRDLPHDASNVYATLDGFVSVPATTSNQDYWDDASTFLGSLILPGDVIEARDPQNTLAGATQFIPDAGLFLIHVVGDAPGGADEGASPGDVIDFFVNGLPAGPTALWVPLPSEQHRLTGATDVPGVTVEGAVDRGVLPGDAVLVSFMITNTGTVSESFNVDVSIDPAWTVTIFTPSAVGPLAPGETAQVDVLVDAPSDAVGLSGKLTVTATAASYAPANCGAFTMIDVTPTGVSDVGSNGDLVPSSFSLSQNYPNPFNPETTISFHLAAAGHVRLEIFNIVGQTVDVVLDEIRSEGEHLVQWHGRDRTGENVPSGIYFYRLHQGAQTVTRQMVLLR